MPPLDSTGGERARTKAPGSYPERTRDTTKLAWLATALSHGLVIIAGALALDLHNQKRRLEDLSAQLKQTLTVREMEGKVLGAKQKICESALKRLDELQAEGGTNLKKLGESYAQREPLVRQATEVQTKLQAVANDLLELARIDQDAKAIVRKYNIQQNSPAPSPVGKP